jgi:hypothetical protein
VYACVSRTDKAVARGLVDVVANGTGGGARVAHADDAGAGGAGQVCGNAKGTRGHDDAALLPPVEQHCRRGPLHLTHGGRARVRRQRRASQLYDTLVVAAQLG